MIKEEYKYSELTGKIIGCAIEAHKQLRNGFQEVIYQRALAGFIVIAMLIIASAKQSYAQSDKPFLTGNIRNYNNQPLYLYQCYGDSLIFIDSVKIDDKGKFVVQSLPAVSLPNLSKYSFSNPKPAVSAVESSQIPNPNSDIGLYRFNLTSNQWFYILNDSASSGIEIKTVYHMDMFNNYASDSLEVVKSDENKTFYQFQHTQLKITTANYFIKEMMRLYPLQDPFHPALEKEWLARYKEMNELFKEVNKKSPKSLSAKIINAYYQPINPDWKQPDPWRDSIIAAHYFDYFNPADSFYLHTNILPEKMDIFLTLSTNKRDAYGQPVRDEMLAAIAAQEFLEKVKNNKENFEFCLKFLLKELDKEKQFIALLTIYDLYVKPEDSSCEPTNTQFDWIRKKADILKNIQIGSIAPDFEISTVESINYPIGFEKETLRLSSLQSDYTLLLFWATWCKHCTQVLPEIKKAADEFNMKQETANLKLITVAVSLDTDNAQWRKFVTENNLLSFLNFSELKGWKGKVSKQYNVYATPTMFLLDKDKKIIFQPLTINELILNLEEICKKANAIH